MALQLIVCLSVRGQGKDTVATRLSCDLLNGLSHSSV